MKLRNRLGYLNVLPEERPKIKLSSSFTIVIYFSLLLAIFLYLFFFTLSGFFYLTARGHVELSKYFIQTDRNGTIARFLVRPEDKIVPGQPLFEIKEQSKRANSFKGGALTGRSNGSLQVQMLSLEQLLIDLSREDGLPSDWRNSGGVLGSRDLLRVVSDINITQSKLRGVNREREIQVASREALVKELSKERVVELEKFGKRVIPVQLGVAKDLGRLDREIVRRENSLSSLEESLRGWRDFSQNLGKQESGDPGVLVSREIVRINNEVESRGTALILLKVQLSKKRESRNRFDSGFAEVRILELGKGRSSRGNIALDSEIEDLTYKVADLENKVESLIKYRRDLVDNEINSLEYKIRDEIKKVVGLRRNRLEGSEQYKVIATEHKFVGINEVVHDLLNEKNGLERKLNSLINMGINLAKNEVERIRYEISREQYDNKSARGDANGNGGYVYRPGSGYGNFIFSPVEGAVVLLYRREGEYAKRGDVLLSVREKGAEVMVKGFFKTRNMNSIQLEKEVTVKFPDNSSSTGVIKKFYSSLSKSTGATRSPTVDPPEIVVDIVPRDPANARLWERYDQLEVSIEVRK